MPCSIWPHDIDALIHTGARFSSMVGHTAGSLLDEAGATALLRAGRYHGTVGLEAYASVDGDVALQRFSSIFGDGAAMQQQRSDR
jgi:hypothetical protein